MANPGNPADGNAGYAYPYGYPSDPAPPGVGPLVQQVSSTSSFVGYGDVAPPGVLQSPPHVYAQPHPLAGYAVTAAAPAAPVAFVPIPAVPPAAGMPLMMGPGPYQVASAAQVAQVAQQNALHCLAARSATRTMMAQTYIAQSLSVTSGLGAVPPTMAAFPSSISAAPHASASAGQMTQERIAAGTRSM